MVRRKLDGAAPRAELVWEAGGASQRPGVPAFHQSWLLVTVYNQAWEDQGPPWPPKVPDQLHGRPRKGSGQGLLGLFVLWGVVGWRRRLALEEDNKDHMRNHRMSCGLFHHCKLPGCRTQSAEGLTPLTVGI